MAVDPSVLSEPGRIASLQRAGMLDPTPEEAFDRMTRLASRVLGAPVALVSMVDDKRQFFKSAVGLTSPLATERETPLSHSYCQFVVASGAPLVVEDARTHPLLKGNPAIIDYDAIAYCGIPIVDGEGHVLGSLCVVDDQPRVWSKEDVEVLRDLAGTVIAEVQLRLLSAELEEANAALVEFVAVAAHDIRNPLTSILGFSALLSEQWDQLPEQNRREWIETIERQATAANTLVNELLEAARLEADAVQPSRELVDVCEIVERVAAVLPGEDCAVQVEEGLTLHADALHVQRIVTNLVSNALKYGAPPVTVSASRDGGTVRIACSDHGQGVPPAFVPRLFHKFARSEEARAAKIEGTGLGLAIVAGLVRANGGTIRYEPNEPHGARFVVEFPSF